MRPSCGRRFSAMSMLAMTLMREMIAAWKRFSCGGTGSGAARRRCGSGCAGRSPSARGGCPWRGPGSASQMIWLTNLTIEASWSSSLRSAWPGASSGATSMRSSCDHPVHGVGADAVELLGGLGDVARRGSGPAGRAARRPAAGRRPGPGWKGSLVATRSTPFSMRDGNDVVLEDRLGRQLGQDLRRDGLLAHAEKGDAQDAPPVFPERPPRGRSPGPTTAAARDAPSCCCRVSRASICSGLNRPMRPSRTANLVGRGGRRHAGCFFGAAGPIVRVRSAPLPVCASAPLL